MNICESCGCDNRRTVIEEIGRERALVAKLRALVLPMVRNDGRSELVLQFFEDILRCSTSAIAGLESGRVGPAELAGEKRRARKNNVDEKKSLEEEARPIGHKRRKNAQHTGSLVTPVPDYDGYQWRKYGQKWINKAKYSRSYYRCTNSKEQGCPATKTVQQMDGGRGGDAAKLYAVDHYGQHTCKSDETFRPRIVETAPRSVPLTSDNSQCSSPLLISELGHDQTIEDSFMLPDMSAFTAEIDVPGLLQMASSSTLDSEHWEMDGLIGFGDQEIPMCIWGNLSEAMMQDNIGDIFK